MVRSEFLSIAPLLLALAGCQPESSSVGSMDTGEGQDKGAEHHGAETTDQETADPDEGASPETEDTSPESADSDEQTHPEESDSEGPGDEASETTTGSESTESDGSEEETESEDESSTTDVGPDKDIGDNCLRDDECFSGHCWIEPDINICAECKSDEDCRAAGTGVNCHYDWMEGNRYCSNGGISEWCDSDTGCLSGICRMEANGIPLVRGYCSECHNAEECRDQGKGLNCSSHQWLNGLEPFSKCTPGELGEECMTDAECAAPGRCADNDVHFPPGHRSCSECRTHGDCNPPDLDQISPLHRRVCHTSIRWGDTPRWAYNYCVRAESIPAGEYCLLQRDGDEACEGFCARTEFGDDVGICGPCRVDHPGDCPEGQSCTPASIGPAGPVPSSCG